MLHTRIYDQNLLNAIGYELIQFKCRGFAKNGKTKVVGRCEQMRIEECQKLGINEML
jgi:hypothetical protein